MYILQIIPIAKGLPEDYFSYFSKEKTSLGALVEIKIRNRKVFGIVREINEVKNEKINLKSQNFSLKKIERLVKENFIDEKLFQSISESSVLLGVKESELIENYLPNFIFQDLILKNTDIANSNNKKRKTEIESKKELIKKSEKDFQKELKKNSKNNNENKIIGDLENRMNFYLKIIKRDFKDEKSTVIFFPNINDIEEAKIFFEKNNIKDIAILHSQKKDKEIKKDLENILNKNIKLILSTPSLFPFFIKEYSFANPSSHPLLSETSERHGKINLNNIIIEKENSNNYFTHTSKRQIDARIFLKKISKDLNIDITIGGNILSIENIKNAKFLNKENKQHFDIIDMAKEKKEIEELKESPSAGHRKINIKNNNYNNIYFSRKLIEKFEKIKKEKGKIFLFTKRKGLFTETICGDCNNIFKCEKCDKPYILFKKENTSTSSVTNKKEDRYYICSKCKDKIELNKDKNLICNNCGSWKMNTIGIGVEGIEKNLKEIGFKTFTLDSENAKTKSQIKKILDSWQNEDSSILIGTDLALNFINKDLKIDFAAIISLDSLFSIPEINIDEKIFGIALDLKDKINTKENIIIQTRLIDQNIWKYIKEIDIKNFAKDEMDGREQLLLPPFTKILKFKIDNKNIKIKKNIEDIFNKIYEEEMKNTSYPQPLQSSGQLPQGKGQEIPKISWRLDKDKKTEIGIIIINKNILEKEKDGKIIPTNFAKKIHTLLNEFDLTINPQSVYQ